MVCWTSCWLFIRINNYIATRVNWTVGYVYVYSFMTEYTNSAIAYSHTTGYISLAKLLLFLSEI